MKKIMYPAFLLIAVAFILEGLVRMQVIHDYLMPSPSQIYTTYLEMSLEYKEAFLSTLSSVFYGLTLSFLVGNLLAFIFSLSTPLRAAFLPFSIFFQTIPIVAIAPLMVIWFGFGEPTVRASAFIVSLFPILTNSTIGLSQFESTLAEMFQLYRASRWQRLIKLQIPSAIPYVFAGLKISSGLAVIGAIVGEFVSGGGLGSLIDSARTQQRVDIVFGAIILSSFLGILLLVFTSGLEKIFKRYGA